MVGAYSRQGAQLKKCPIIIGVDRFSERLDMAKEFGATHVFNTSGPEVDLVAEVKAATDGYGSSVCIDTTGNFDLIKKGMDFTANRGQMIILGVPPVDALLNVHLITFMQVNTTVINRTRNSKLIISRLGSCFAGASRGMLRLLK